MRHFALLTFFVSLFLQARVIEAPLNPINYQQNPPALEWKVIETAHFEIIFPKEIERDAQRVAHLLEKAYPFVARSLEAHPKKIPLVLQNQTTTANAFVTLAPRRTEWSVTPAIDPELTNTEWLKTLAIHEFRHVVQFEKTKRGFNSALYFILGEVGQALGLALTAPPWFYEGDAVGLETALTRGGRGRLPVFERNLRTLLLSGQDYSYDKAHMGSFRDYIPNHYVYGYFYTTYMRNHYGDLFLSTLINRASKHSYNPLTFYNSMDDLTPERNFEKFYESVMKELLTSWKAQLEKFEPTPYEVKNPERDYGWTNYLYPQTTSDGKIIALKRGLSFISQFVSIKGNKEEILFYPGVLIDDYPYKVRGDKLAFVELELDPRWGYRDFARLKVYDFKKKKFIEDRQETKLRLATLDHEGLKTLAVEWTPQQEQFIVVLGPDAKRIETIPYTTEQVITSLDWVNDNEIVMVVKDRSDLKQVLSFNLLSKSSKVLLKPTNTNLGFIYVTDGRILLESPESGIDNIYLLTSGSLRQLTRSRYGAYAPALADSGLIYNEYTPEGMSIAEKKMSWDEEQNTEGLFVPFYKKFASSEDFTALEGELKREDTHVTKDYSRFKNAVNFHSWLLLAPPLSNTITLAAYSSDILNTFSLSGGYQYNLNEQTSEGFVSAAWSYLYPVFDLRAAYGGRKQDIRVNNLNIENRWEEGTLEAGVQIPWKNIYGRFLQNFTMRAFAKIIKVTNKLALDQTEVTDGALFSPGAELIFSHTSRLARRDWNPPWGISLMGRLEEGRDITGDNQRGAINTVDSRIFIPGLWKHHSFYHQLAYERQRDSFYQYESTILYPRGTTHTFLDEFRKYSGNYWFPVFYPDWNISRYLYLQRIAGNLFYDALNGRVDGLSYRASSAGWEILFDTNLLRLALPLTWGVRGSYVLEGKEKTSNYELFIATTLGTF